MKITEPYIRKKGEKFIIEQKIDGKTKYLKTLPDAQSLLELLNGSASKQKETKASQIDTEIGEKEIQKFGQSILTEPIEKDANVSLLDIKRAQDKIMEDILSNKHKEVSNESKDM